MLPIDPAHKDFSAISSEEFYERFTPSEDEELEADGECPEWIQEQLDEDVPF